MKLTNVQFMHPISIGGFSHEHIQKGEGTVEMLDFPWVRVTKGGKSRRTTVFNIKDCDDWADEPEQAAPMKDAGKRPK